MTSSLHAVLRDIKKQVDLAMKLINEETDINAKDDKGETLLNLAIEIDNPSIVKLLVKKKANVNTK